MTGALTVFGVASPYAFDVVESLHRLGRDAACVDNHGGADPRLPGLTDLTDATPRTPFTLGLSSAAHSGLLHKEAKHMIVLGLILLILGLLLTQSILTTIGLILIVVGLVLNFVPIGGSARRVW